MRLHIYQNKIILIYSQVFLPGEVNFLGRVEIFSQAGKGIFSGKPRYFHGKVDSFLQAAGEMYNLFAGPVHVRLFDKGCFKVNFPGVAG